MGSAVSIQTAVNNIRNEIQNTITQEGKGEAIAKCNIEIGSIKVLRSKGCTMTLVNNCKAQSKITMTSIIDAAVKVYNNLTNEQKQSAPIWFTNTFGVSTTNTNIVNDFKFEVKNLCESYASTISNMKIDSIVISDCEAPKGQIMKFPFINSGEATAICAMEAITKMEVAANNEISNIQEQGVFWEKLIFPICFAIIAIVIGYLLVNFFKSRVLSFNDQLKLERTKKNNYVSRIENYKRLKEGAIE